jgi:hypothetical protein
MAQYLPSGGLKFPSQGSNEITEKVKHFDSDVSFDALQLKINLYLLLLKSPIVTNRPLVRDIRFQIVEKTENPDKGTVFYYAQLHYTLIGDGDDDEET